MTDDELLALARKATPGPYHVGDERLPVLTAMGVLPHRHIALLESVREPDFKANADYLKALAPENIIALIERHRAEVEAERKLAEDWQRLHGIVTRRAEAAESALAAAPDDGADRVISDLLIASAPYADMDETGRLPKAREQAERLLNEPDLSAKQRYANHYEEQIGFLVERFAEALSSKLRKAEGKYQYQGAWRRDSWHDALVQQIRRHMDKGDPLDVAAYCAFAWHHGWTLAAPHTSAESALAAAQKRVGELQGTVAFFASVIKSGEPWTQTCEDALRAALKESGNGDETVRPDQQVKR